ncbi:MAG: phosphate ABC transporter substrate-binding protein [Pseudomonadales bacterium]|nr:phosphate ABC transporter substrate-binding protein [Pseudomonadales bacterium]
MKSNLKNVVLTAILVFSTNVFAEISVIVHPSNEAALSKKAASKIFLGKSKKFADGGSAIPIEQADGSSSRKAFHAGITQKKSSQLKAYWSRIIFTGKGQPPKEVSDDAAVIALVSKDPKMIGYVDSASVNDSVKVVLTAP